MPKYYSHEEVEKIFLDKGYELLSKFIRQKDPLSVKCPEGHITNKRLDHFMSGHGCDICARTVRASKTRGTKRPNQVGELNHNWKGGRSNISDFLRQTLVEWKFNSLKHYNFKCVLTGENNSKTCILQLHHLESINVIIHRIFRDMKLPDYQEIGQFSEIEVNRIKYGFRHFHEDLPLGLPLHHLLHKLFHDKYKYGDNTTQQFEEFKSRLKLGEFNYYLSEHNLKIII